MKCQSARVVEPTVATRHFVEQPVWVKGCLRDHVGITTDIPQIADDLLRSPFRQSRAITGHSRTVVIPFTLLTSSPNGIELLVGARSMATLPPGGTPGGITHDFQTEGYLIISGGGTMFTDGYIVNGRHNDQNPQGGPNGPTCGGMAYDVKKVTVKVGDVVIVPPGVVHGWADIPDHVDYLSFRPSQSVLQAGWVNPTIAK